MNARPLPGFCAVLFSLFLMGCDPQEPLADDLRLTKYEWKRESKGCETTPDQCFTIRVDLPLALDGTDSFQVSFNEAIRQFVLERLNEFTTVDGSGQDVDELIDSIFEDYESYLMDVGDIANGVFALWNVEIKGSILFNSDEIVCLMTETSSYTGGAHPNTEVRYINFDKQSGEILYITDVISQSEPVRIMALEMLKASLGISEGEDISDHGFLVTDEDFVLPENFAITHKGLEFVANPYEIAPYAMGPQKVAIPFEAIKEYLILEK